MGMSENEFKISDGFWGPIFLPHINTKRQKPKWVDLGLKPRCFVKNQRFGFLNPRFCMFKGYPICFFNPHVAI